MSIRKSIRAKMRGKAGESIAETLIALLISALALMMLAGAISAAANVVTKSRNAMDTYNDETVAGFQNSWASAVNTVLK